MIVSARETAVNRIADRQERCYNMPWGSMDIQSKKCVLESDANIRTPRKGEYMLKRITLALFVIVLCIAYTGCAGKAVTPISSESVDTVKMAQYIDMAKQYWQAVYDLGSSPQSKDGDITDGQYLAYSVYYAKAEEALSYSESDWEKAYVKTLIIRDQLNAVNNVEDQIAALVDGYIKEALDTGGFTYIDESSTLDIKKILKPIGEKYELTYEAGVDTVLRPFWESLAAYDLFSYYYATNLYLGTAVEWDGTNIEEYSAYMNDLYAQYDAYIEGLYQQAVKDSGN